MMKAGVALHLMSSMALAEEPALQFAPGATGSIGVDATGLMERAAKDAEALKDSLTTAAPQDLGSLASKQVIA